jgi:hypothetical protein
VDEVRAEHRIVVARAVVLGRQTEVVRIWSRVAETGGDRPLQAGQHDELRHRGAEAVAPVGLADVHDGCQRLLAIRQHARGGRLLRDKGAHLLCAPATSASALTAPPLLAKTSTGPVPIAAISRWRSSACSSGVDPLAPSVRSLRLTPRGSYVTTVRSRKCPARVVNPLASIGEPIISSGGTRVSASASRTS